MNKSDKIDELAAALVLAQPEFETADKGSTNPFFKSKYADLGAVWDAVQLGLKSHGLTVSQFPDNVANGAPALTTILLHKSGQWISATYPLMVTDKDCTPQGYGSALTYARRYGLSAVLGVVADEDDDGNAASKKTAPAKPKEVAPPQHEDSPEMKRLTALRAEGKEAAEGGTKVLTIWRNRLSTSDQMTLDPYIRLTLWKIALLEDKKVPA